MAHWPPVRQHGLFNDRDNTGRSLQSSIDPSRSGDRIYTSTEARDNSRVHQGDIVYGTTIHNHFHAAAIEHPTAETDPSNIRGGSHPATRAHANSSPRETTREELAKEAYGAQQEEEQRQRAIPIRTFNTLSESLRFLRMSARLLNVEQAASDTCQWIFQHNTYRDWKDDFQLVDHHGFLWIKGKPGSGKSTIMKLLHDSTISTSQGSITFSYFFNGRASGDLEKSSLGLFRYLVSQTLKVLPSTKEPFLTRFESKVHNGVVEEWTATELKGFLSDALCGMQRPPVNIFIDALDEGHVDDVRQLVAYLEQLALRAIANGTYLRICLSSRHYPHITIRKGLSLMLDDADEHNQDIRTFVSTTLELEAETLIDEICERAAGVFLWVILVVPRLNAKIDEGADLDSARALLHKLPTDLDALFTGILDRDADDMDECVGLLQWVSFAQRALSPETLYEALRISSGETLLTIPDIYEKERLRRFFLHRSRGLLEITRDERPVVQFIHETVRTFLLTPHGLPRIRPVLATNIEGSSHEMLKQFCLSFVIQHQSSYEQLTSFPYAELPDTDKDKEGSREESREGWPKSETPSRTCCFSINRSICLHEYAVRYIFRHSSIAESHGVAQKGSFKVIEEKKLLTILCHCFLLYKPTKRYSSELFEIRAREKSSYAATVSEHHLVRLVNCMVGKELNFALFSSALAVACSLQNVVIARSIMEDGLKNNHRVVAEIKKYSFFSPASLTYFVQETIRSGSVNDVKILFELGVEVNAIDAEPLRGLSTALQAAVYWNRRDIFDLLIKSGADVNQYAGFHGTALHVAAHQGQLAMAVALIKLNAFVNAQAGVYGTALLAAAYSGHQTLVKYLLVAGADVNLRAGTNTTPLQAAAWALDVSVEIIELLLAYGASINAPAGKYGSALHAASTRASSEIMLDDGAGHEHDQNTCHAAHRGACKIAAVKALLRQGATITAEDWQEPGLVQAYHELFSFATESRLTDLISLLLDAATDGGNTDGKATHALWSAALFGNSQQISLLLDHGAKPPSEGIHLHSRSCERWVWDRFQGPRWYLTSHFDWLMIHDDGYCRGGEDSTSHFVDDIIFNP